MTPTEITYGIPKNQRVTVSKIFLNSFEGKFQKIFANKNKAVSFISTFLRDDRAFVALKDGVAVGFVGLEHDNKSFIDANLRQTVGLLGLGVLRAALFGAVFMMNRTKPNEVYVESLAVSEKERAKGIGKKLLKAAIDYARLEGFSSVRLDVIGTNRDAKRLYERFGFKESRVQRVPFPFSKLVGFGKVSEMVYAL
ncbi:MAG: hypothetical protein CW716_02095 [Candidatus Bathyarchaeum sp.]|nr:MAG: hypothetical protein CW716_02095 [Candidatus Bathyarchaeum sp.]